MATESYIKNNDLAPGTIIEIHDFATAVVHCSGDIIQKKRGNQSEEVSYCVFDTFNDWLDTFSSKFNNKYALPINIWSKDTIIPPSLPIYQKKDVSPYKIVVDILRKNHVKFRCNLKESKNMSLAKAKIDLLKLEYETQWINLRADNEKEWLNEFSKRYNTLNAISLERIYMTTSEADKREYKIFNSKYPRVYIKTNNGKMVPVYYTQDGTESVIINGCAGKTWWSLGIYEEPEFWVTHEGEFIKQEIIYYLPSSFDKPELEEEKTQLELAFSHSCQPDEYGFLPDGRLVFNPKTKKYLQLWEIV
jgi:hypothetical protein